MGVFACMNATKGVSLDKYVSHLLQIHSPAESASYHVQRAGAAPTELDEHEHQRTTCSPSCIGVDSGAQTAAVVRKVEPRRSGSTGEDALLLQQTS